MAFACENESENAKRMRIGLEPVSQPMPTLPAATVSKGKKRKAASKVERERARNGSVKPCRTKRKRDAISYKSIQQQHTAQDPVPNPINTEPKVNVSNFNARPTKLLFILNLPEIKYKRRGSVLHKCVRTIVNVPSNERNQAGPTEGSKKAKVQVSVIFYASTHTYAHTPVHKCMNILFFVIYAKRIL